MMLGEGLKCTSPPSRCCQQLLSLSLRQASPLRPWGGVPDSLRAKRRAAAILWSVALQVRHWTPVLWEWQLSWRMSGRHKQPGGLGSR